MARMAGVHIPASKPLCVGLTYIYGIGRFKANEICNAVKIDGAKRIHTLSDQEVVKLRSFIEKNCLVEGELRRSISTNIKRLVEIGCFRGVRHRKSSVKRKAKSIPVARSESK